MAYLCTFTIKKNQLNVGKYAIHMDGMGISSDSDAPHGVDSFYTPLQTNGHKS